MLILAAIVTHNRCKLLSRCIDHIHSQSRPPDALVVINNGSTDNTLAMLAERRVDVISQTNLGSAGGWHRAINHCQEHDFDAVWLMDDDGYPALDALQILEQKLLPSVACASSVVLQEDRPDHFVFPFPVLDSTGLPVIFAWPRKLPTLASLELLSRHGSYHFAHLFNGALVSSAAIRQIGNINTDYFIAGDDVDYFFRLRRFGEVISVLAALHFHPDVSSRPFSSVKLYYYIRNSIVIHGLYFNHRFLRNAMTIFIGILRTARRNSIKEAASYIAGKRLPILLKAIRSGFEGRLGHDYYD